MVLTLGHSSDIIYPNYITTSKTISSLTSLMQVTMDGRDIYNYGFYPEI